jgi:hypothetical protein
MHACTLANERQCICAVAAATGHAYGVSDARQGGCLEAIRVYGVDGVGGVYDNEGVDGVDGVDGARRGRSVMEKEVFYCVRREQRRRNYGHQTKSFTLSFLTLPLRVPLSLARGNARMCAATANVWEFFSITAGRASLRTPCTKVPQLERPPSGHGSPDSIVWRRFHLRSRRGRPPGRCLQVGESPRWSSRRLRPGAPELASMSATTCSTLHHLHDWIRSQHPSLLASESASECRTCL